MVRLDPRYAELKRQVDAHHEAVNPVANWCRECQQHLADASGLCPICKDDHPSSI